jgi:hypothetical protein
VLKVTVFWLSNSGYTGLINKSEVDENSNKKFGSGGHIILANAPLKGAFLIIKGGNKWSYSMRPYQQKKK